MAFNSAIRRFGAGLSVIENALAVLAALCLITILVATTADVVMRYGFNAPLGWAFDLVVYYLLVATFFLGFPMAMGRGEHIAVDFLSRLMPQRMQHALLAPACMAAAAMVALMAWFAGHEVWSAWLREEVIAGAILWPVWLAKLCIPVALWPIALRLLQIGLSHGATALDPRRFPFAAPSFHTPEE